MSVKEYRVLNNMEMRLFIFTLLLFQTLVTRCSAKYISVMPNVVSSQLEEEVQDSIRQLVHTGIYSHRHLDPSQVSVTTPVKVTQDGELVSHSVEHAHEHGHARARRDVFGTEHTMDHSLHYNITVDGRDLRLDLRPSVSFITPGMIIERHYGESRTRERPRVEATSCHYTGSVRGQPSSRIAISACDGLAGLLRTEHGEYWIEPSNHTSEDNSSGRPHVIFKRSAVDKVKAYHRAKREVQSTKTNQTNAIKIKNHRRVIHHPRRINRQRNRSAYRNRQNINRSPIDPKTLQLAEKRRRRLEILRRNPEYRRQQMERKRLKAMARSSSTSSVSKSKESAEARRNNIRNRTSQQRRIQRVENRRRRRRAKNCATYQPPYQWNELAPEKLEKPHSYNNYQIYNKTYHQRRYPHHHQLSHRPEFETSRRARSVSIPRHVEVMLVADRSMTDFHRQGDIQTYLLTIMNMVSSLYMDPSIGNFIKIVVVKIVTLEKLQAAPELDISSNADLTLSSFCHWQQQENPDNDNDPYHHDVAILVTRKDICSQHDVPCSTLGVAHVAGMCKPDRSCSVNEDNGIMLAHTITHELGHNFGLYHDTEKIGCHRREGSTLHIMTPFFEADTVQVAWSKCSKRDVTMFLDSGFGECLGDEPSKKIYEYPEAPAGVTFDAAIQCRLQFGVDAAACSDPSDLCKHLWCYVNNTCKSMLRPPAPGTTCGPDMWCQNQECVARAPSPAPVDGGWGPWTEWSKCSRSCGAGVSTQSRECNNPRPTNSGKYCIGDRSRYKVCNTDACPINEPTFRELQCSKFANMTYNNDTVVNWRPLFDQEKPCELICVPRDSDDEDGVVGGIVADGTRCGATVNNRDTCIAGVCYKVGCDWEVNSDKEEDACGVCGGDGTACKTVQGIYNKGTTKQSGLSEVAIIPAGSRNVKIQEKVNPKNYISIGSAKSRRVYFNGYQNATKTEYFVAGSHAIYERDRDWEKLNIPGPIAEDIKVYQRIIRGHHLNPGVTYQYTVDRRFRYRISEWSPCSVTCGVGYMRRHYECVDKYERKVDLSQCYNMEPPRHEVLMQQCRQPSCDVGGGGHTHWWVGSWSPCSRPCRTREEPHPTKSRKIYCVDKRLNAVTDDSRCDYATKPTSINYCDVPVC